MERYNCLFVDHAGRVFGRESFDCEDDGAAIAKAQSLYAPHIGKGIELWRSDQCIYIKDDKHSGAPLAVGMISRCIQK